MRDRRRQIRLPRFRAAALAAVLALAPACHHHPVAADAPSPPRTWSSDQIPLVVINRHWLDVIVSVVRDGQASRLGIAGATGSATFMLPARLLGPGGELRLWGHPIGGAGGALTESVLVQPGQWVEWTLESDLDRSTIGVY